MSVNNNLNVTIDIADGEAEIIWWSENDAYKQLTVALVDGVENSMKDFLHKAQEADHAKEV